MDINPCQDGNCHQILFDPEAEKWKIIHQEREEIDEMLSTILKKFRRKAIPQFSIIAESPFNPRVCLMLFFWILDSEIASPKA